MKKIIVCIFAVLSLSVLTACDDAQVASRNLSKAADNFEIIRKIVFFNGITDTYLLEVTGRCSIRADTVDRQLELTCKDAPGAYFKHFLGLSDNVSYLVQQVGTTDVSVYHTRFTFKPQQIIPDIDFRGSSEDLLKKRDTSD